MFARTLMAVAALLPAFLFAADAPKPAPKSEAVSLSPAEAKEGFVSLFDGKTLKGWVGVEGTTNSYYVKDGLLICKDDGKEHIFTEKEFANFILRLDIKLDTGSNNGVGIRTKISKAPHLEGMEIQVLDDSYFPMWKHGRLLELKPYQYHGSIYGVVPAKRGQIKPTGQWNEEEIVCDGRKVQVKLNGAVTIDADLDQVTPIDGHEHPGLKYEKGRIGLHAHGNYGAEVFFRNIRIKELK